MPLWAELPTALFALVSSAIQVMELLMHAILCLSLGWLYPKALTCLFVICLVPRLRLVITASVCPVFKSRKWFYYRVYYNSSFTGRLLLGKLGGAVGGCSRDLQGLPWLHRWDLPYKYRDLVVAGNSAQAYRPLLHLWALGALSQQSTPFQADNWGSSKVAIIKSEEKLPERKSLITIFIPF